MRFGDKQVLCRYGETWHVCKAMHRDYLTLEATLAAHAQVQRQALVVPVDAVTPTLMLLNGRRPTCAELSDNYHDDQPW